MKGASVEFLIVGQGLVGTNLAFRLWELGRSFRILDAGLERAASVVSAGLLNPVTGPRLNLSWQAGEHLREAEQFYRKQEERLGIGFYKKRSILRILRSEAEKERWARRMADPAYAGFLSPWEAGVEGLPENENGFCRILNAASIEPEVYLEAAREWFLERGVLERGVLRVESLKPGPDGVEWDGGRVAAVVFCEGWSGVRNPWFDFLPLEPAKGEIIRLRPGGAVPEEVINGGKWIFPLSGEVRVGSTFRPGDVSETCTPVAAKELARRAREILGWEFSGEVVGQQAGIRPCSRDKLPFLGRHPRWPGLVMANGFGAKGALTSPLCALRLARHLVEGAPLHRDEDIARWIR